MAMPNISAICAVVGIGLIVIPLNIAVSRKRQETKSMKETRAREAVNMPPTYSAQGKNKNKKQKKEVFFRSRFQVNWTA
jgi:inner membrane protein involved in colicin E2 resistance